MSLYYLRSNYDVQQAAHIRFRLAFLNIQQLHQSSSKALSLEKDVLLNAVVENDLFVNTALEGTIFETLSTNQVNWSDSSNLHMSST